MTKKKTRPAPADLVTLESDRRRDPYLIRAYRGGKLVAYAVQDAYGWAIVARVDKHLTTVDRYKPLIPEEADASVRDAAIRGLTRYAATGVV